MHMGLFTVDHDRCKRDAICVSECPMSIIEIVDEESFPSLTPGGEEYCINCGHCASVCPYGAFSLRTMPPEQCTPVKKKLMPTPEQVDHFLRARRSIRTYRNESVDHDTLAALIDTARYAPSGHNMQPVHWLVIKHRDEVRRLAEIVIDWMRAMIERNSKMAEIMHFDQVIEAHEKGLDRVLRGAPHLIIAHGSANSPTVQHACMIALTYLELVAFSRGLGTCWAGYFTGAANAHEPWKEALSLPEGHQCYGALMVGHPMFTYHRVPLRNEPRINWR
jgi:nitroreductase/NAD-dependent dihydropyrimidine dehydrogenase PreA subunit